MGIHERPGESDEWFTPEYIFEALQTEFDIDVAHPEGVKTFVPAKKIITSESLEKEWSGFIWMNPPWCKDKDNWIEKFIKHQNGIALMPDSTSAKWYQKLSTHSDIILLINKRVKFIKPDGTIGSQPANGTTLFAIGKKGIEGLKNAQKNGLGICFSKLYDHRN